MCQQYDSKTQKDSNNSHKDETNHIFTPGCCIFEFKVETLTRRKISSFADHNLVNIIHKERGEGSIALSRRAALNGAKRSAH